MPTCIDRLRAVVKSASLVLGALLVSHCDTTLDTELEGKRCSVEHACLPGYVCSPENLCVRPSRLASRSTNDLGTDEEMAGATAGAAGVGTAGVGAGAGAGKTAAGMSQGRAGSEPPDIPILTVQPPGSNAGAGGASAGSSGNGGRSAAGTAGSVRGGAGAGAGRGAAGVAGDGTVQSMTGASAGAAGSSRPRAMASTSTLPAAGSSGDAPGSDGDCGELALCGDACVDLVEDRWNCGGCGIVCEPDQRCRHSRCVRRR